MKTLTHLFILFCLLDAQAWAQEHGGHGKNTHPRRHHRSQQQQQQSFPYKRNVVRGDEAQKIVEEETAKGRNWSDVINTCSEPVAKLYFGHDGVCFDRGENFDRGSRYKCYIQTEERVSVIRDMIFNIRHNDCGGDGIHQIRHRQH